MHRTVHFTVSSHLHRHFPSSILSLFFPVASREGVKWYLAVVCVSLTITDVSHLFMCFLAVCVILFGEMFIPVLCPFFTRCLVFCCWIVGAPYVFWMLSPLSAHDLQVFSPILWLPFPLLSLSSDAWMILFSMSSVYVFIPCQPPFLFAAPWLSLLCRPLLHPQWASELLEASGFPDSLCFVARLLGYNPSSNAFWVTPSKAGNICNSIFSGKQNRHPNIYLRVL